jgi:hypothetical protein
MARVAVHTRLSRAGADHEALRAAAAADPERLAGYLQ